MSNLALEPESNRCPNCAERINAGAIICRFCQHGISAKHFRPCINCAEMVRIEASRCRFCQTDLPGQSPPNQSPRSRKEPRELERSEKFPKYTANFDLINERAKVLIEKIKNENLKLDEFDSRRMIRELVSADGTPLTMMERGFLLQKILDEVFGFGPLGPLLRDPSVRDIYVYGPKQVQVFRARTGFEGTDVSFENDEHIQSVVRRIFEQPGMSYSPEARINTVILPNRSEVIVISQPADSSVGETILIIRSPA